MPRSCVCGRQVLGDTLRCQIHSIINSQNETLTDEDLETIEVKKVFNVLDIKLGRPISPPSQKKGQTSDVPATKKRPRNTKQETELSGPQMRARKKPRIAGRFAKKCAGCDELVKGREYCWTCELERMNEGIIAHEF